MNIHAMQKHIERTNEQGTKKKMSVSNFDLKYKLHLQFHGVFNNERLAIVLRSYLRTL